MTNLKLQVENEKCFGCGSFMATQNPRFLNNPNLPPRSGLLILAPMIID